MGQLIETGTLLQLKGSHSIKRFVPNGYNSASPQDDNDYGYRTIKEGDIVLVLGLAPPPWNTNEALMEDELYPTLSILLDGEYCVIRQFKLLCYLYKRI